jgi:hypothetical protein
MCDGEKGTSGRQQGRGVRTLGQKLPVLTVSMELGIGHHFAYYTVWEIPNDVLNNGYQRTTTPRGRNFPAPRCCGQQRPLN